MKFAHIRVSEYFTFAKQIFHSEAISLARRANFVEKSTCFRKCFFWLGYRDSNPNIQSQSLLCYRYTIRLSAFADIIIATMILFVNTFFEKYFSFFKNSPFAQLNQRLSFQIRLCRCISRQGRSMPLQLRPGFSGVAYGKGLPCRGTIQRNRI